MILEKFIPNNWHGSILLAGALFGLVTASVTAQNQNIKFDGSLGTAGSNGKNAALLNGPNYAIQIEDGQLESSNLFHSFEAFALTMGETATFESTGITNILTRVTGGAASSIDGGITANANLFFMNPNGVMFGPNSSLNVSGAFTVTTADRINLDPAAGGGVFAVSKAGDATLSSAPIASFGFLTAPSGVRGAVSLEGANLSSSSFHVISGDVTLQDDAQISSVDGPASIISVGPGAGTVDLSQIGSATGPTFEGVDALAAKFGSLGNITVTSDSSIESTNVFAPGAPQKIVIRSGQLQVLNGGSLFALGVDSIPEEGSIDVGTQSLVNVDSMGGGFTNLAANGDLKIKTSSLRVANGGSVATNAFRISLAGITTLTEGGNISIQADDIDVSGGFVEAVTRFSTDAGSISIQSDNLTVQNDGIIRTSTSDEGNAGSIAINAGNVHLAANGHIRSDSDDSGSGGLISIAASNLALRESAIAANSTGSGDGGTIQIKAGAIDLKDSTINSNAANLGLGGTVTVEAKDLQMTDSFIAAFTFGQKDAGNVAVKADNLQISGGEITTSTINSGDAGSIVIEAENLNVTNSGLILSSTGGAGDAGSIRIDAGSMIVSGSGSVSSATYAGGNAGSVTVTADSLDLRDQGAISTSTGGTGNAGRIVVDADVLRVRKGGFIASDTQFFDPVIGTQVGTGSAGSVQIQADSAIIQGQVSTSTSGPGNAGLVDFEAVNLTVDAGIIASITAGTGNGGTISITTDSLNAINGGVVNADTFFSGQGGDINVVANQIKVDGANKALGITSGIEASAFGRGDAGTITVDTGVLEVTNGAFLRVETLGEGRAGDINIDATRIRVDGVNLDLGVATNGPANDAPSVISVQTFGKGEGGSIRIKTRDLEVTNGSVITATTFTEADGGDITINAKSVKVEGVDKVFQDVSAIGAGSITTGAAGQILIATDTLEVLKGGVVRASSVDGPAGSINVRADEILVDGTDPNFGFSSEIDADSFGLGDGGSILLEADTLTITNGGNVGTNAESSGNGGDVRVTARDIFIDGAGQGTFGITAESSGAGDAGSINLNVTGKNTLRMQNGAIVSTKASGQGNAGSIDIDSAGLIILNSGSSINVESLLTNAGSITLDGGSDLILDSSSITARAGQNAGNIEIRVPDTIRLDNSAIIAEAGSNGGNIIIDDARFLLLNNSTLSANAILGTGGFIQIGTDVLFQNNSNITASSEFGADGEVRIDALSDLSAAQAALDAALLDASNDLQERCAVKLPGQRNSFILVGRGGLPVMPGRFLPGHQLLELP
tara:strand:- start:5833 stop:9726 length:3894 start_codon:yes stop_codon:yes gene_type:complete